MAHIGMLLPYLCQFIAYHLTRFFGWPPSCFTFCVKYWPNKARICTCDSTFMSYIL